MKVKFKGESDELCLLNGKIYDVFSVEEGYYRIIDESDDSCDDPDDIPGYLYPPSLFDIVEE